MRTALALLVALVCFSSAEAQGRRGRWRPQQQTSNQGFSGSSSSGMVIAPPYTGNADSCKDAMEEVNAYRAKCGLRPFINDPLLNQAAWAAAQQRASRNIHGHLPESDFSYLPAGAQATAAGCGALEPSWGWGTCCMDGNYTYGGAAWVMGPGGRRFMHLFVR